MPFNSKQQCLHWLRHHREITVMLSLLVFYCVYKVGSVMVHVVLVLLLPGYWSLVALETPRNGDQVRRWLKYWIIYATLGIVDSLHPFLSLLPLYSLITESVLVWCALPQQWHGADFIYNELSSVMRRVRRSAESLIGETETA